MINTFVIKNKDLGNNNRQFGRQREQAKRDLVETAEKNDELNNELSLIRFELKEMRKMLTNVLEITLEKLMKNMFTRSEIIIIFKELINAVNIKEKVK
ncbi:hypothetical protein [Geminocystis sp.]|uniref:hypothetical protein n=1 Tax=Geminocystis sp. TaxID=2664100 RepID=UPI003594586D